jgi:hypothetical protein
MRLNIVLVAASSMALAACAAPTAAPPAPQPLPRLSESGTLFGALLASDVGAGIRGSDVPFARKVIDAAHGTRAGARLGHAHPRGLRAERRLLPRIPSVHDRLRPHRTGAGRHLPPAGRAVAARQQLTNGP